MKRVSTYEGLSLRSTYEGSIRAWKLQTVLSSCREAEPGHTLPTLPVEWMAVSLCRGPAFDLCSFTKARKACTVANAYTGSSTKLPGIRRSNLSRYSMPATAGQHFSSSSQPPLQFAKSDLVEDHEAECTLLRCWPVCTAPDSSEQLEIAVSCVHAHREISSGHGPEAHDKQSRPKQTAQSRGPRSFARTPKHSPGGHTPPENPRKYAYTRTESRSRHDLRSLYAQAGKEREQGSVPISPPC